MNCHGHSVEGMVNVVSKRCKAENCRKQPTYGVEGTKVAQYCAQHKVEGLVNVRARRCAEAGCNVAPTFGRKGFKKATHCVQHAETGECCYRSEARSSL